MSNMCVSRFNIPFSENASNAFGKSVRIAKDSQINKKKPVEEPSRFRLSTMDFMDQKKEGPAYTEEATNAFGKKQYQTSNVTDRAFQTNGNQDGFSDNAMYAFGKKSKSRKNELLEQEHEPVQAHVMRNTIASLVTLATDSLAQDREWSTSALRTATSKPEVSVEMEDFPALGSPASSKKKSNTPSLLHSSPKPSFANLVKIRAEEEEKEKEKADLEAQKKQEMEKKRKDSLEYRKQAQILHASAKQLLHARAKKYEEEEDIVEKEKEESDTNEFAEEGESEEECVEEEEPEYDTADYYRG